VGLGGTIRGRASGSGLPLYLVPADQAPHRYPCHGNGICEPVAKRPPGPPFVLLGRLRRTASFYARQRFAFPVPRGIAPGLYRLFLYCRPCGGSLIQSGPLRGETLRIG
jgi:hypothetical protein